MFTVPESWEKKRTCRSLSQVCCAMSCDWASVEPERREGLLQESQQLLRGAVAKARSLDTDWPDKGWLGWRGFMFLFSCFFHKMTDQHRSHDVPCGLQASDDLPKPQVLVLHIFNMFIKQLFFWGLDLSALVVLSRVSKVLAGWTHQCQTSDGRVYF